MRYELGFWGTLALIVLSFVLPMSGHFGWFACLLIVSLISHVHFNRKVNLKSTDRHKKIKPRDLGRYRSPGRRS